MTPSFDPHRRPAEAISHVARMYHPAYGMLSCFRLNVALKSRTRLIVSDAGNSPEPPASNWVNTALGNIKTAITGTYRSIASKHLPRYLAEFEYRFNRRYDLAAMARRLFWASARTPPMPYRPLKLAEVRG